MKLWFKSNKKKQGAGATCIVECFWAKILIQIQNIDLYERENLIRPQEKNLQCKNTQLDLAQLRDITWHCCCTVVLQTQLTCGVGFKSTFSCIVTCHMSHDTDILLYSCAADTTRVWDGMGYTVGKVSPPLKRLFKGDMHARGVLFCLRLRAMIRRPF